MVFPELSLTGYELDAEPVSPTDPALDEIVDACAVTGSVALVGSPVEEDGRRFIAMLRIEGSGATVAYRKSHLGGDERARFKEGDGPTVITVDGWRIGLGICKDTGVAEHTAATAHLGVDRLRRRSGAHAGGSGGAGQARTTDRGGAGSYVAFASRPHRG